MIVDSLESFEKYCDIEDGFQKVYSFIKSHKLAELEEGEYEIDGRRVYCTVWSGELKSPEEAKLEVHDSYIDIQLLLEGAETIGHKDRHQSAHVKQHVKKQVLLFHIHQAEELLEKRQMAGTGNGQELRHTLDQAQ